MTSKVFLTAAAALSLFGFAACGGSDKDDEEETDASVIVADAGGNENPGDAGHGGGDDDASLIEDDAGGGSDDGGITDGGSGGCPGEKPIELNGKCYAEGDDCDENFEEGCSSDGSAVFCLESGVTALECGEGTTCGIAKDALELDWDGKYAWGVDCMLPCEKSGDTFTVCGEGEFAGSELEYVCSRLEGGGFGAYCHYDESCDHGCDFEENQCILLDPDEGKWCSLEEISGYEGYAEHCTVDGVVVYCNGREVAVDFCDEGYTCRALKDGSHAGCFNSEDLCTTPGTHSGKTCYVDADGKEYVATYLCSETSEEGVYVWMPDISEGSGAVACDVNCVPGSSAEEEAHCGLLDDRIGQPCTKEEANAGSICGGGGKLTLSCYSNGTERLWHSGTNCIAQGNTCLTTEEGQAAGCYGPATFCAEGNPDTHYCEQSEIFGTEINISFTYSCTKMSDGSFHQVPAGSDACESTCNEITGMCD